MSRRFKLKLRDMIKKCIAGVEKNPTTENINKQFRALGDFMETHADGLVAELELVGSALEKSKKTPPGDVDLMSEKFSLSQKANERLRTENESLKKEVEKAKNELKDLEKKVQVNEPTYASNKKNSGKLLEHYKKENARLRTVIENMENVEGQSVIHSLNERINALNLELDQIIEGLEAKDAELEIMNEMYRSAEFDHAVREASLRKQVERLEKKLMGNSSQSAAAKAGNPASKKKSYPPICGWHVYYNDKKDSFYAKRTLYGKMPLNLYVGKTLSPSAIKRTIPKIRNQESKHGLGPLSLSPNDLSLKTKVTSS